MNDGEWDGLKTLWQSGPTEPALVTKELARLRRRRTWFALEIVWGSIISLVGLGIGVALIRNGGVFYVASGIATCVFVGAVCAIALWALRAPKPLPDDAVPHAVAIARQSARAGVRHAASMIWGVLVGLVFAAFMCLARAFLTTEASLAGYAAVGAVLLMLAAWLGLAFRFYQARSATLARLDEIAAALEDCAPSNVP